MYTPAGVLNATSPTQGHVLGAASGGSGKGKQNPHSKDREESEEPRSDMVQLMGQSAVLQPNYIPLHCGTIFCSSHDGYLGVSTLWLL